MTSALFQSLQMKNQIHLEEANRQLQRGFLQDAALSGLLRHFKLVGGQLFAGLCPPLDKEPSRIAFSTRCWLSSGWAL